MADEGDGHLIYIPIGLVFAYIGWNYAPNYTGVICSFLSGCLIFGIALILSGLGVMLEAIKGLWK